MGRGTTAAPQPATTHQGPPHNSKRKELPMKDLWSRCQAADCDTRATIKLKTVSLCSHHIDVINRHVHGTCRGLDRLTAHDILRLVTSSEQQLA